MTDATETTAPLARAAAERLADLDPALPQHVAARLHDGADAPQRHFDAGAVALATLVVGVANLAWTVVVDLHDRLDAGQSPDPDAVARAIRVRLGDGTEIEIPPDTAPATIDRIVRTCAEAAIERAPDR